MLEIRWLCAGRHCACASSRTSPPLSPPPSPARNERNERTTELGRSSERLSLPWCPLSLCAVRLVTRRQRHDFHCHRTAGNTAASSAGSPRCLACLLACSLARSIVRSLARSLARSPNWAWALSLLLCINFSPYTPLPASLPIPLSFSCCRPTAGSIGLGESSPAPSELSVRSVCRLHAAAPVGCDRVAAVVTSLCV